MKMITNLDFFNRPTLADLLQFRTCLSMETISVSAAAFL